MKLFVINGENNDDKIEIHIYADSLVQDVKQELDKILLGNGNFTKIYFGFIYKNIILCDEESIKHYKLCENDEIWFGKIENYLKEDEVIVHVYHTGYSSGDNFLIVKMSDTISTITSIIESIHSKVINIWNIDGKQMRNDQIVTEINTNENYELIIRFDDRAGNMNNITFDECCYWHDKHKIDLYSFFDKIYDDNKNESTRTILLNRIIRIIPIISSNDSINDRLNQNLSEWAAIFRNSTNSQELEDRAAFMLNQYWMFLLNQYQDDDVRKIEKYFQFKIQVSLSDDITDDRLNQNLSDMDSVFLNSTNLFSDGMEDRLADITRSYLIFLMNHYNVVDNVDFLKIFDKYSKFVTQIIFSDDTIDDRLNQNLSNFPSAFLNSTNLFCEDITNRIVDICRDYWIFGMHQYGYDVMMIVIQYFPLAISVALSDYSLLRQRDKNKADKSIGSIVIDALYYFMNYFIDPSKNWQNYWLELWKNQYLLRTTSEADVIERIDEYKSNKLTIKTKINGKISDRLVLVKPKTISEAKESLAKLYKVYMKHLYCIKPGGDHKPNDEDAFDDKCIIEIVMSMDDIEILRPIGQGAFAKIYLCQDKISNKQFVLKKSIQSDRDLYRNLNIYSKLNSSENIMNYSGLFSKGENICIRMEYMSGGSLRSYLDKVEYLQEQEIVKISFQILTQINELHKLGIIHRDIKSDNIVLDKHNNAKLIDFGLSKYTIGLSSKDMLDKLKEYFPGTCCYMAPDLLKREFYSAKIDIWSFGMVLVEMVTLKRPFYWLKLPVQAIVKIKKCTKYEFKPIRPISDELNQLIDSCLNTNPDERPSAEQLIKSNIFDDYEKKIKC